MLLPTTALGPCYYCRSRITTMDFNDDALLHTMPVFLRLQDEGVRGKPKPWIVAVHAYTYRSTPSESFIAAVATPILAFHRNSFPVKWSAYTMQQLGYPEFGCLH